MASQPVPCPIIDSHELDKVLRDFDPNEEKGFGCLSTEEGLLPPQIHGY